MVDCQGGDVFDIPAEACRRGWDENELMHLVFEHREEFEDDANSVVFQCGVVQEPRCVWPWMS